MAQNLSGIILRQQLQATIASTRPDTLTNPKVGATFSPAIKGGLNTPEADVLYTFTAVNGGTAGSDANGVVTLTFSTAGLALSGSPTPTVTNRSSGGIAQDAEGVDATGLAATGRIVALLMYTNPAKHTSNIRVQNTVTADSAEFFLPYYDFVTGGSDVKSLLVVPRIRPANDIDTSLTLQITFGQDSSAGGLDELNVVVLGRSS